MQLHCFFLLNCGCGASTDSSKTLSSVQWHSVQHRLLSRGTNPAVNLKQATAIMTQAHTATGSCILGGCAPETVPFASL